MKKYLLALLFVSTMTCAKNNGPALYCKIKVQGKDYTTSTHLQYTSFKEEKENYIYEGTVRDKNVVLVIDKNKLSSVLIIKEHDVLMPIGVGDCENML